MTVVVDLDCGMCPNTSGAGKQPRRLSKSPVTEKKERKAKEKKRKEKKRKEKKRKEKKRKENRKEGWKKERQRRKGIKQH